MKITLVRPAFKMENFQPVVDIPLGLLSLATVLVQHGHQVRIIDFQLLLLKGLYLFGEDYYSRCSQLILEDNPELIGFTALCNSYPSAILLAQHCKELSPKVPIIFGGPEASFVDVETLQEFDWIDAVARGEGELLVIELVERLTKNQELSGLLGVTYRSSHGQIIKNPDQEYIADLDSLPFPDYSLLDMVEDYFRPGGSTALDVGRGCPYNCRYCSTSLLWRRQFRIKSPERIVAEIKRLADDYGVKTFKLTHDLFTVRKDIALEFCQLVRKTCPDVTWACSARTNTIDDELLDEFARSGCQMIFYGIESGSPETLEYFRKNIDLEQALHVVKATLQRGIQVMTSFIFGAPMETEEHINQTIMLALRCKVLGAHTAHLHLLVPESGTEIFAENRDRLVLNHSSILQSIRIVNSKAEPELELIERYPHIFSTFYMVQLENVSPQMLREIELTYHRLLAYFPRTIYVFLNAQEWQPLFFFNTWKHWLQERMRHHQGIKLAGDEWSEYIITMSQEEIITRFADYVKHMIAKGLSVDVSYLLDLLNYEITFLQINDGSVRVNQKETGTKIHVHPNQQLKLSQYCDLGHYSYSIPAILEELKELHIPIPKVEENYLIFRYLGDSNVQSIVTNYFTYDLVSQCTSEVTLNDLKTYMFDKWAKVDSNVGTLVDQAVQQLVNHGFIEIVS